MAIILTKELEDATEAMERIHARGPFGATQEDTPEFLAKDVAIVMHFLKTTMPRFIDEFKAVAEDV